MVTENAFMLLNVGSVMYCICVPPDEAVAAPSPVPAADVCTGPLHPRIVIAIRTAASLTLAAITDNLPGFDRCLRFFEMHSGSAGLADEARIHRLILTIGVKP